MDKRVDHIGIAVRSIRESRRLYETLGLQVETIEEIAEDEVRVAMIPCGETRIELIEPMSKASPVTRFLERRGPGIHHICLATDRLNADQDRLREAGFETVRPKATLGAEGCWVQFIHPKSSGGVLLELSQAGDETDLEGGNS